MEMDNTILLSSLLLGIPAIVFMGAGVLLVRNRLAENAFTIRGVLSILAISFGALLLLLTFVFIIVGGSTVTAGEEEWGASQTPFTNTVGRST